MFLLHLIGDSRFRRSYTTVHISPEGQDFLDDDSKTLKLLPTKELRNERKVVASSTSLSTVKPVRRRDAQTAELMAQLTQMRERLAAKENAAPYMVFSEEILAQLAVSYHCVYNFT